MSAFAPITLVDEAAGNIVFSPSSLDKDGVATWRSADTMLDAQFVVTQSLTVPKTNGQMIRLKQRIMIPIFDAIDTTKKIGEAYANVEIVAPRFSTDIVRKDLRAYAKSMLGHAVTTAALSNLEAVY
jgi:hypothetical protein